MNEAMHLHNQLGLTFYQYITLFVTQTIAKLDAVSTKIEESIITVMLVSDKPKFLRINIALSLSTLNS